MWHGRLAHVSGYHDCVAATVTARGLLKLGTRNPEPGTRSSLTTNAHEWARTRSRRTGFFDTEVAENGVEATEQKAKARSNREEHEASRIRIPESLG
jgi:hypothetical protein